MLRNRRRSRGMTLLEVLIAMAIFAVGSLGVLAMVTASLGMNAQSRQYTESSLIGQWKLEQLQVMSPAAADLGCTSRCWADSTGATQTSARTIRPADLSGTAQGSNAHFQLTWTTSAPAAAPGMIGIHVVVAWPRDKDLLGIAYDAAEFVDCFPSGDFDGVACKKLDFYTYRTNG